MMLDHSQFATRDYWGAAFLDLNGVRLARVDITPEGRANFVFANEGDQAYNLFIDFKAAECGRDLVPLRQFRASYRHIQDLANRAKEDARHDRTNV